MEFKKVDKEFMAVEKVGLKELIKWRLERVRKRKDYSYKVPRVEQVEIDFILNNRNQVSLTFIGHCTFLIQMED